MMKNIFSILILFFSVSVFSQESIAFEKSTFDDILAKAKKENKLVFLDAYASWCGPCKLMEKNVFPQEEVKNYYNANFVNAHFDMEKGEGRNIASKYSIRSYPHYLFLNGDGEVVYKGMGYLEKNDFLALGKEANALGQGGSMKDRFAAGEKDTEFLMSIMKMNANTDPEFAKKASERYFEVRKQQELTKDEVSMLLFFTRSTEDVNYKHFTEKKSEIIKHIPETLYDQFDTQLRLNAVVEKSINHDSKKINDQLFLSEASKIVNEIDAKTALNRLKIGYYPSVGNFSEYEKTALEYYGNGEGFDNNELNTAAFIFSENIKNPQSLKQAVVWAEKSVMSSESPENTYILAKLYLKTGNKDAAKMFAQQSVNLTKQKDQNASVPEKLLSEIK